MPSSLRKSSRHGAEIPAIGLGTGGLGEDCGNIVAAALAAVSGCGGKQSADLANGKKLFAGKATCGSC